MINQEINEKNSGFFFGGGGGVRKDEEISYLCRKRFPEEKNRNK